MNKLVVVRHGGYGGARSELTAAGIKQIQKLAEMLGSTVAAEGNRKIFSSPESRAQQSAGILGNVFSIPIEIQDRLWTGLERATRDNCEWLYDFLSGQNLIVAIVVTHIDFANDFPTFFASKEWGVSKSLPREVKKGEGVVLDLEARTMILIEQTQAP